MARAAILVAVALVLASGCATSVWLTPQTVEEFPTAKVRLYRNGRYCRVEIITPTETIQSLPSRCMSMPHRVPFTP